MLTTHNNTEQKDSIESINKRFRKAISEKDNEIQYYKQRASDIENKYNQRLINEGKQPISKAYVPQNYNLEIEIQRQKENASNFEYKCSELQKKNDELTTANKNLVHKYQILQQTTCTNVRHMNANTNIKLETHSIESQLKPFKQQIKKLNVQINQYKKTVHELNKKILQLQQDLNEKKRPNEQEEKAMELVTPGNDIILIENELEANEEINIQKMTKEQLQKKYKTLKSKNLKLQKNLTTLYSPSDDKSDFPVIESIKADFDTLRKQNFCDIFDDIQSQISDQYENKLNEENEDLYDAIVDREARKILFDLLQMSYHFMRVFKRKTFNDIIEHVCTKFELKSIRAKAKMSKSLSMIMNPYFQTYYRIFIRNKYMRDDGKNNKNNELFSSDMNVIIEKIFVCVKEKYNYFSFWDVDGISKRFRIFIAKACELCWLMVLNDPQLYFYPHLFSVNDDNISKIEYDKNVNYIYSQQLIFGNVIMNDDNKINENKKEKKKKRSKKKGNELEEEKDIEKEIDFIVQKHDYCNPFESKTFDDKYHELLNEEDNESDEENENENENKNIIKYNGTEIAYIGWPSLMRVPKMLNEQHTQITKTLVYCDHQSKQFMAKMLPQSNVE